MLEARTETITPPPSRDHKSSLTVFVAFVITVTTMVLVEPSLHDADQFLHW